MDEYISSFLMKSAKTIVASTGVVLAICMVFVAGCEDRPNLPEPNYASTLDTSYIQVYPPLGSFTNPQDVLIGNDQLLYVADTDGDRVVMMNRAGQLLSSRRILKPISLAQDTRLDLLVGGTIEVATGDTAAPFRNVAAVFRIHLFEAQHVLDTAPIDTVWTESAHPDRRFPGITVLENNDYLVVRTGPDNSSFVDPDAAIMLFSNHDVFVTPIPAFSMSAGNSILNVNKPTAIASFPGLRDFVLTQSSEGVTYAAVWMVYELSSEFDGWKLKYDPGLVEDRNVDFIRPYRYIQPEAVTIDKARRDIFVADAQLDSVFKFNNRGKLKSESFGLTRSGGSMTRPTGLTFFEKVLYVLDAPVGQPGRVLRFKLTTDFPR